MFIPKPPMPSLRWVRLTRIRAENRYYTDPYLYNCKYDPVQDAIYVAESRAIAHAISKGVMVIAAGASGLPKCRFLYGPQLQI